MRVFAVLAMVFALVPVARADTVWYATHLLEPGAVVHAGDVEARTPRWQVAGALPATQAIEGLEMRRRVLGGHELSTRDVGPPLLVQANAPVVVLWRTDGLAMEMSGRALEAGSAGEVIRILNTGSSRTIRGTVQPDGTVLAEGAP